MEIRPLSQTPVEPLRASVPTPNSPKLSLAISARPVEPAERAQRADPDARPDRTATTARPGLTHMRVEIDPDSGVFIRRILDAETGSQLAQFPNEAKLAFSRAVAADLRRQIDLKA